MESLNEFNTSANVQSLSSASATASADTASAPSLGKQNYAERKEQQKKIRRAEKDVKECEERISKMEKRLKELDSLFMNPENAANMELVTEYTSITRKLDEENNLWMSLSEKLEDLKL